jgi:hypothetical protein
MATIELASTMPEEIKTDGEEPTAYAWYIDSGEFICSDYDAALAGAMRTADLDLGEALDEGEQIHQLYKVGITETTTAAVHWGPSGVYQSQYDAMQAAGIID